MTTEREMEALSERYSDELLKLDSVAGVGVEEDGPGQFVLVIHLSGDTAPPLPKELQTVPVRFVRSGPFNKF